MNEQTTLTAEVRASLPPIAQAYIAFLESQIALLREQVTALQVAVAKLEAQVADTQARAQQNSGNSSRPPSSDPPGARPHLKHKPSGRKRGEQKGHPGHARIQLAAEQITAQVEHHLIRLLTVREYCEACEQADLVLTHQPEGTEERGRYIGVRPRGHAGNFGMVHTGEQYGQRVRLGFVCTRRPPERHDDGCARALNFTNLCGSQG